MKWKTYRSTDCPLRRSDLRLIGRAFREGWVNDPTEKALLLDLLLRTALHPEIDRRTLIASAQAIAATKMNSGQPGQRLPTFDRADGLKFAKSG